MWQQFRAGVEEICTDDSEDASAESSAEDVGEFPLHNNCDSTSRGWHMSSSLRQGAKTVGALCRPRLPPNPLLTRRTGRIVRRAFTVVF